MADLFDEYVPIERPNIPELLDRLRRFGDRAAGEEVLNYYWTCYAKQVFYYLRSLGLNKDVAEDVQQNTFINFWQALLGNLGNFELGESEAGYL